mgnify:CR=1 FL=1
MFNHVNFGDAFAGNNGEGPNPNFVQKNIEGFDMTLDPSDGGISHVLYHVGVRERAFMSLLHSIVPPEWFAGTWGVILDTQRSSCLGM